MYIQYSLRFLQQCNYYYKIVKWCKYLCTVLLADRLLLYVHIIHIAVIPKFLMTSTKKRNRLSVELSFHILRSIKTCIKTYISFFTCWLFSYFPSSSYYMKLGQWCSNFYIIPHTAGRNTFTPHQNKTMTEKQLYS